ncbi:Delta(24)-sterol reductase [Exophiala dermatitidis]
MFMAEMLSNTKEGYSLAQHEAAVARISAQIAAFHREQTPFRIYHGSTNSTRPSVRTRAATVDISSLNHVISVSVSEQRCLVEPNVAMDALVAATLPLGLVPPVVPEFPGISVGGGYAGTAGESSSFKHGFFDQAVEWVEVVLANGEVVTASKSERQDLFHGMPGTFGTLGVATLFEICLVPAKEFVEISYLPVHGIRHAQQVFEQVMVHGQADFLDGIMFAPESGVVMVGQFAERDEKNETHPVVTFTKPWDQWFYLHAEDMMKQRQPGFDLPESGSDIVKMIWNASCRELVPVKDYLFRYDRGAFWMGRYAFSYFLTPFNRFFRWLGDRCMHTRVMYHALHRSGLMQRFIIQDMALPNVHVAEFSNWLDGELPDIYPRWVCPLKTWVNGTGNMHPHVPASAGPHLDDGTFLNIGVWGPTPRHMRQVMVNRCIEAKLKALHGMKWLYGQTFYTEDEFWSIYDRKWYDALRNKYHAQQLPNVYEKVRTRFDDDADGAATGDLRLGIEKGFWSIWPFAGIYGVLSTIKGGDYLRKR